MIEERVYALSSKLCSKATKDIVFRGGYSNDSWERKMDDSSRSDATYADYIGYNDGSR